MAFRIILLFIFSSVVFGSGCRWLSGSAGESNSNVPVANEPAAYADAESALAAGNKFFEEDKVEQAIEAFKQAVKMNPDLAEAYFKLGLCYSLIESEQELIVTSDSPSDGNNTPKKEKKPNSTVAFENAVTAYKKIVGDDPKNDVAFFNLGRVLNRLNDDKESRKALESAVKLKPDDTKYQTELGAILVKLAQYDEAVRALNKALEIDDANAQALELLEKAKAGKKRVDFGAEQIKDRLQTNQPSSSSNANTSANTDGKSANAPEKRPANGTKKPPAKPAPASNRN